MIWRRESNNIVSADLSRLVTSTKTECLTHQRVVQPMYLLFNLLKLEYQESKCTHSASFIYTLIVTKILHDLYASGKQIQLFIHPHFAWLSLIFIYYAAVLFIIYQVGVPTTQPRVNPNCDWFYCLRFRIK